MTFTRSDASSTVTDAEALIEEARQRQRRRRRITGATLIIMATLAALSLVIVGIGGTGPPKPSSISVPGASAGSATSHARPVPSNPGLTHLLDVTSYGVASDQVSWAATSDGVLYLSDNAGVSWHEISPPFAPQANSEGSTIGSFDPAGLNSNTVGVNTSNFAAFGTKHLWIASTSARGPGSVTYSVDGGHRWHISVLPGCAACSEIALSFVNATTGYASNEGSTTVGSLFRTTDGGARWSLVNDREPGGTFVFSDADHGWISDGDYLVSTSNGGRTWHEVDLPSAEGLQPIAFGVPQFFGPENGVLLATLDDDPGTTPPPSVVEVTRDGGAHWHSVTIPDLENANFIALGANDWIVQGQVVEETLNAGITWTTLAGRPFGGSRRPGPLLASATFVGTHDALVLTPLDGTSLLSNNRELLRSADDGRNWTLISSCIAGCVPLPQISAGVIAPEVINAIAPAAGGRLYIADGARDEVLERSRNGMFRVVAGDERPGVGACASTGEGSATSLNIGDPAALAFAPGGPLYILDTGGHCLLALGANGSMKRIAGNGRSGYVSGSMSALAAPIGSESAIAVAPDGDVYLAGSEVLRLHGNILTRLAGAPPNSRLSPDCDGTPTQETFSGGTAIAVDASGDVYTTDAICLELLEITPSGALTKLGSDRGYEGGNDDLAAAANAVAAWGFSLYYLAGGSRQRLATFNTAAAVWSRKAGLLGMGPNGLPDSFLPGSLAIDRQGDLFVATNPGNPGAVGAIAEITEAGKLLLLWKSPPA